MITMKDLPFPEIGKRAEYTLPEDCLLDDSAFSDKPKEVAKAGDVVVLTHCPNYGLVSHKTLGSFRY